MKMVRRIDLMALNFYKKEPLTGSLDGMRYRIKLMTDKESDPEREYLQVVLYPDVKNFESTEEALKQYYEFPFTEEGMVQITEFLNTQAVEQQDLWKV